MTPGPDNAKGTNARKPRGKPGGGGGHGRRVRHEHSAGVVLFRSTEKGRLYLVLDYGKHWDYPKGHLEKGETAWQAAVRELMEETGISAVRRVGRFERDMQYGFFSPRKGRVSKRVTFFLAETSVEAVRLSDEHVGHAWLPVEDAVARLTYENAKVILLAADATL